MARWFQNGRETVAISVNDRGLQYADGVFETIAIRNGEPRLWSLHIERLELGCRRLGIDVPDALFLASQVADATMTAGYVDDDALLKIIVTRGEGERGYAPRDDSLPTVLLGLFARPLYPQRHYVSGVDVRICHTRLASQPRTAGIKLLSRIDQVLARSEWSDSGVAEGLMLDQSGAPVCGTMTNLFVIVDDTLHTPEITQCGVSGVMRRHILTLAHLNGIPVTTGSLTIDMLNSADEIFLCNSQIGIWPVSRCGRRSVIDWPATRNLMSLLRISGVIEGPQ